MALHFVEEQETTLADAMSDLETSSEEETELESDSPLEGSEPETPVEADSSET